MDMKMFNAFYDAIEMASDRDRLMAHVDLFCVDAPSNKFHIDTIGDASSIDTETYNQYSLSENEVSMMLSFKDMNKYSAIKFLKELLSQLEERL